MREKPGGVFIELIKPIGRIYILFRAFTKPGLHRVVVHVINFLARLYAVVHRSGVGPSLVRDTGSGFKSFHNEKRYPPDRYDSFVG